LNAEKTHHQQRTAMVHHIQKITVARSPVFCSRKDEYQQEYLHTYANNIAEKTKATEVALFNSKKSEQPLPL
jgi:hypothetical protein